MFTAALDGTRPERHYSLEMGTSQLNFLFFFMNNPVLQETDAMSHLVAALGESTELMAMKGSLLLDCGILVMSLVGQSLKLAAIDREVRSLSGSFDPEDVLTDKLLHLQRQFGDLYQHLDLAKWSALPLSSRVGLRFARHLLRKLHARTGALRIYVMEHEADVSGLSGSGPFTSIEDLLKHLDS